MTMTPTEAIDRIVYLLDRMLAPTPKVRAFQRAKEIVYSARPVPAVNDSVGHRGGDLVIAQAYLPSSFDWRRRSDDSTRSC